MYLLPEVSSSVAAKIKRPQKWAIIVLLLLVGAGLLYWFFFLRPALAKIGDLRETNAAQVREIAALKSKLAEKPEIEKKWKEISDQEAYLRSRIPRREDLPQVLGTLEELIQSSGLDIETFSAGELQQGEGYLFIPVTLRIGGSAGDLLRLLEELEQFTHFTLTKEASIEEGEGAHRLNVSFNLIFIPEG